MSILNLPPLLRARLISLGAHPKDSLPRAAGIAAQEGNARLLSLLLLNGAESGADPSPDACPLELAAGHGHEHCVALLLPHITDQERLFAAINRAAGLGFLDCTILLADALGPGRHFLDPLLSACAGRRRSTAEFLIPLVQPSAALPDIFAIVALAKLGRHYDAGVFLEILAERMVLKAELPVPSPTAASSKQRL